MLISQLRLEQLIKQHVPEKYHPRPEGPVRSILIAPADKLMQMASNGRLVTKEGTVIDGLMLDVATMMGRKEKDHFVILLSDRILLEDHMVFVLLHEIGHVDAKLGSEKFLKHYSDNEELYADMHALDRMSETLGFQRALDALAQYCSTSGFGKELSGGEKVKNVG
jgi:Zn-dependent protease with chaperone function